MPLRLLLSWNRATVSCSPSDGLRSGSIAKGERWTIERGTRLVRVASLVAAGRDDGRFEAGGGVVGMIRPVRDDTHFRQKLHQQGVSTCNSEFC